MKRAFVFEVWGEDLDGIKEVLVVSDDEERACEELCEESEVDFEDYELKEEIYFDEILLVQEED